MTHTPAGFGCTPEDSGWREHFRPSFEDAALYCAPAEAPSARELLYEELERYHYRVREVEVVSEGDEIVELAATLVPTSATEADLDAITDHLKAHADIEDASWTVSTTS